MMLRRFAAVGALSVCFFLALLWLVNPAAADEAALHPCVSNFASI